MCTEDNSGHIVPTAWLVSLLGDSSAFLKALSPWLGALFRHPWSCVDPMGASLHGFPNSTGSQRPWMRDERPLRDQGQAAREKRTRWALLPTCPNSPLPASYKLWAYRSGFSLWLLAQMVIGAQLCQKQDFSCLGVTVGYQWKCQMFNMMETINT